MAIKLSANRTQRTLAAAAIAGGLVTMISDNADAAQFDKATATYTVQSGDALSKILKDINSQLKKLGVAGYTQKELQAENGIKNANLIDVGQEITAKKLLDAQLAAAPAPAKATAAAAPAPAKKDDIQTASVASASAAAGKTTYKVRSGDDLGKVCRENRVFASEVIAKNPKAFGKVNGELSQHLLLKGAVLSFAGFKEVKAGEICLDIPTKAAAKKDAPVARVAAGKNDDNSEYSKAAPSLKADLLAGLDLTLPKKNKYCRAVFNEGGLFGGPHFVAEPKKSKMERPMLRCLHGQLRSSKW